MCAYSVFNTFPVYPLSAKPLILLAFCRYRYHTSLFVTHEIDEALTVATRIAILSDRPASVCHSFTLPGAEGRDASAPELSEIRREIIHHITH